MLKLPSARLLALCATIALTACGDSDATGPDEDTLVGTWAVVSIDGQSLPLVETFTLPEIGTCTFTTTSITITFRENETFSDSFVGSSTCFGESESMNESTNGTYRTSGGTLFLMANGDDEEGEADFSFSGEDRLTLRSEQDGEETVFVLERQ